MLIVSLVLVLELILQLINIVNKPLCPNIVTMEMDPYNIFRTEDDLCICVSFLSDVLPGSSSFIILLFVTWMVYVIIGTLHATGVTCNTLFVIFYHVVYLSLIKVVKHIGGTGFRKTKSAISNGVIQSTEGCVKSLLARETSTKTCLNFGQ